MRQIKQNIKKENKICFILHSISALLFTLTGVMMIIEESIKGMSAITNICLGITFGSLAYTYYKRYKNEK